MLPCESIMACDSPESVRPPRYGVITNIGLAFKQPTSGFFLCTVPIHALYVWVKGHNMYTQTSTGINCKTGNHTHLSIMAPQKLVTDCKLKGRDLQSHEVDLIFARVKEKKQRSIGFEAFQDALSVVAEKKGQTIGTVRPPSGLLYNSPCCRLVCCVASVRSQSYMQCLKPGHIMSMLLYCLRIRHHTATMPSSS